jgi:ABC-type dipeptide/oligopeptide/nickel transport system ATPase component
MGFARQVANRVVFMDAGQIVEVQEPEAFFDAPRHRRTQVFLSQILVEHFSKRRSAKALAERSCDGCAPTLG